MLACNFLGRVQDAFPGNTGTHFPNFNLPDLARDQVIRFYITSCSGLAGYAIDKFTDSTLSGQTIIEQRSCSAPTSDANYQDQPGVGAATSNFQVGNSSAKTAWLLTQAFFGFYNSNTYPIGYRQNEIVLRVVDASTDTVTTIPIDGDTYGGPWQYTPSGGATNPGFHFIISYPGADHAYFIKSSGFKVSTFFDVSQSTSTVPISAQIMKIDTSGTIGTTITVGVTDSAHGINFQSCCVDPSNGDLYVTYQTRLSSGFSTPKIDRYDSNLNLISSTATAASHIFTCLTFSNVGGTKIIYGQNNSGNAQTLNRFDVASLTFLSDLTVSSYGPISGVVPEIGGMVVDSVGGYLYRTNAVNQFTNSGSLAMYRVSDLTTSLFTPFDNYSWAATGGPVLTSDGGKLYVGSASTPTDSSFSNLFTGVFQASLYDIKGTFPTAYTLDITKIEEDWEMKVSTPQPLQGSPVLKEFLNWTSGGGGQHANQLRLGPFGANLDNTATSSQNQFSTNNEVTSWTTRLTTSGTNFVVSIPTSSSTTIPDLNTLTETITDSIGYIMAYEPSWSLTGRPGATNLQGGSEVYFDICGSTLSYFKQKAFRLTMSDLSVVSQTQDNFITNPWPACTSNDLPFVKSYFVGKQPSGILLDLANQIGYFLVSDSGNLVNKVNLTTQSIISSATDSTINPYGGYGGLDLVNGKVYFAATFPGPSVGRRSDNTLAFDPVSNTGYTVDRDTTPSTTFLLTVNPNTGAFTVVGNMGVASISGLVFDATTTNWYAVNGAGGNAANLYTVNISTGVATLVGATGFTHLVGLARRPSDGQLFGFVNQSGTAGLVTINKSTGAATNVGGGGTGVNLSAITFHPTTGVLYGFDANLHNVDTINTSTGALTVVVGTPNDGSNGLAWDFSGTPTLWWKHAFPSATFAKIDVNTPAVIPLGGPSIIKVDTTTMTVTKGTPNPNGDFTPFALFDFVNQFGYAFTSTGQGNETIYKYRLSDLTIVATLNLTIGQYSSGVIDTASGFMYAFAQSVLSTSQPFVAKIDLSTFTAPLNVNIPGDNHEIVSAAFVNGNLYGINTSNTSTAGVLRKFDTSLNVLNTYQIPGSPAQVAYPVGEVNRVQFSGTTAVDSGHNLLYALTSNQYGAVRAIQTGTPVVNGSLFIDGFFFGSSNNTLVNAVALDIANNKGYAVQNNALGNVIVFDLMSMSPNPNLMRKQVWYRQFLDSRTSFMTSKL